MCSRKFLDVALSGSAKVGPRPDLYLRLWSQGHKPMYVIVLSNDGLVPAFSFIRVQLKFLFAPFSNEGLLQVLA